MKNTVLGETYDLSIVFVTRAEIRKLNRIYRSIDKATDILSFPLSKSSGEIFINLDESKIEAKKFDREFENFLGFLLIHGLVHLKGMDHGSRMEALERKYRAEFGI
ncbi:MAG: rRNA maturation RNase YbeY [Patescibacteria group bacterium]